MDPAERSDWLPLPAAAERLGVSRLKLREAVAKGVLPSRKDNEGRVRVDLSAAPQDVRGAVSGVTAEPASLIGALFDEIEELQREVSDRTDTVARFADLAGRQQDALETAAAALERSQAESARLAGLLDRSLDLASAMDGRADPAADRALALLEETAAALEESRREGARLAALVGKAVDLADGASARAEAAADARVAGLRSAADRAMGLLERATTDLEAARAEAARAASLLGRATDAAARLEAENARLAEDLHEATGVVDAQAGMVNKLFSLSEHALDAATKRVGDAAPPAPRRSLIARVLGRRGGLE
ncbi:MAG: hypothetical protein AAFU61_00520 [Pseudomonadota bacterium]